MTPEELASALSAFLQRHHSARSVDIRDLRLLTGGASRQTWSFDAAIEHADGRMETFPLVLRSDPRRGPNFMPRELEYRLLEAAYDAGVPVPKVHAMGDDSLGAPGFLMARVDGETIPRKLLRDDEYAKTREVMTAQLGAILASIHRIPPDTPGLEALTRPPEGKTPAEAELDRFEATYRAITPEPHPAFELAIRWLRRNRPPATDVTLVHGDYRIGNVMFGPEGARAILDWELAHVGDPIEDFGFFCVRSWRFGNDALPAGGIGAREEMWAAYEKAGGRTVDPEAARWWEVFGNLRWGVICISQAGTFLNESVRKLLPPGSALELAAIGRRTAETEWELLSLTADP
jgi:aminoglycoside phosphotransferase (APT) family kinase protein